MVAVYITAFYPAASGRGIKKHNKKMRFIAKMGGPIVCYQNKYIIISVNSADFTKARLINFRHNVYWPGEIYISGEL